MGELDHHYQPAVVETLHDPGVPQRAVTVKALPVQLADQGGQLTYGAGLGQPHTMEMVVDIERVVLDPYRLAQPEGFGE